LGKGERGRLGAEGGGKNGKKKNAWKRGISGETGERRIVKNHDVGLRNHDKKIEKVTKLAPKEKGGMLRSGRKKNAGGERRGSSAEKRKKENNAESHPQKQKRGEGALRGGPKKRGVSEKNFNSKGPTGKKNGTKEHVRHMLQIMKEEREVESRFKKGKVPEKKGTAPDN